MTRTVKLKTGTPLEARGSYSRAVAVDDLIFVSNTAGRNPETKEISPDPVDQLNQALDNIQRTLQALESSLDDVVRSRIFIQFREDVYPIMDAYGLRMRGIEPALTMFTPPLASDEYRVEIEVTAVRGCAKGIVSETNL